MQILFPESQAKLTFTAQEIPELFGAIPTSGEIDSRLIQYIQAL